MAATFTVGDKAPDFVLPKNGGDTVKLSDFLGKNVVVYFYPKDNTPGCTTEAQEFRDNYKEFTALDTVIIGISKDSVKKHDNFVSKHDLPFALGSDEEDTVTENYACWKEKSMYGKKFMGIERSTFLIDKKGVVRKEWRKVKVAGHVADVLESVKSL